MNKKQLIDELKNSGIKTDILKAIEKIDRKNFLPPELQEQAYEDYPLSIGYGQTISQPYTVAFMLQELELKKGDKVMEIGTGSGWNAALISHLVGEKGKIYTIEIIKQLAEQAKEKLKHYKNIQVFNIDGSKGLKKFCPYDKIILTAAPKSIKQELKGQLKENGILLAPVGKYSQKMIKIKEQKNKFKIEERGDFVFVPLIENRQQNEK